MTNRPILTLKSFQKQDIDSPEKDSSISKESTADTKITASNEQESNEISVKKQVKKAIPSPQKKQPLLSDDDYLSILQYLQEHYPKCFPPEGPVVPLALGIHNQIFAVPDMPFSKMKIRKFLKIYVSKRDYRKELIIDNSRFNLDGTVASKILPEETNWLVWKKVRAGRRAELKAKHDNFVKKVMESPVAASEFLEEFLPAEYKDMLDLTTLKVEKETYIEDSLKSRLSDIVYSLQTKPNDAGKTDTTLVYAIVEHQSSPDYWIALRLWKYSLLLLERHAQKKNKLPIILPLVVYNGKRKYSVPKNIWELFTHPDLAKKAMAGAYNLIDLNAMSDDDIDYEKHLSFVLYSMKHIHNRNTLKMLEKAMQRCTKALIIDKGKDYVHTKLILWYTDSKVPAENKQLLEQLIVDNLPKEDTGDIMRTIADSYIEQGFEKGILQGIEKCIEKGIEKEKHLIAKKMLQENTEIKFISSVTGLSTEDILEIKNNL